MQDYTKLRVWQRAHELVLSVYAATRGFPRAEGFGLTSQMRRAAASVPANIAEGCGRSGLRDFARFLVIAQGSASELRYHVHLAHELELLTDECARELTAGSEQVGKMLSALLARVRQRALAESHRR